MEVIQKTGRTAQIVLKIHYLNKNKYILVLKKLLIKIFTNNKLRCKHPIFQFRISTVYTRIFTGTINARFIVTSGRRQG